jgi:ribonucleotide reductase alpha subunit
MNSNQLYSEYFVELNELLEKYNIEDELKTKIISGIGTGLPEKEFGRIDFYDYLAKILASNTSKDPIFSKIAGVYQVKIYNKEIGTDYLSLVSKQYLLGLISEKFYNFVSTNQDVLIEMIDWERDELIDYFGLKTLERSYLLKDTEKKFIERPQMMWLRVGIQIHGLWEGEIDNKSRLELIKSTYDLMSQLYFTHATPTLFNSGSNYPQLSSCYLLQCPDDLELIGDSFKSIMMISKWAGGIGINLSDIRSNNSLIKSTGGRTNGIIPLCKTLESIARYVNQSGKRLGSIATFLETWHADIEDFIKLRKNTGDDNLRARDLFLGLWVCDMFMKAVETDGDWYLMNPSDCLGLTDTWGPEFETLYARYVLEGKYVKKIKARELYKKITECQFETGMPYMMFKDTINARSNQQNLGTIKNSNLCVAPETQVLTDKGYFKIADLKDKKVNIWNGEKFSEVIVRQTGVKQKLIKVNFTSNDAFMGNVKIHIECTPYHKFYININGEKKIIEAKDLQPNMKVYEYVIPVLDICCGSGSKTKYIIPPTVFETKKNILISSIEDLGRYDDTYCFNEPEKHSGIFNGILTSNCSEIVEYSSLDEIAVCNLASVSLPKFVSTKVDGTKYFDFETFGKIIQLMVLNLNNVIDMNYYPVPQTAKSNFAHRPIGVGVQGLADCYYLMGYSFDSPEATKLNKQIFEYAYWHGLKMSNELAKTRGKYSTFDGSPYSKGQLQFHLAGYTTEQIADKELGLDWVNLIKSIVEFGTRNSLITTIMPTASTAQILNNNESIEPYTSNIYVRKVLAGEYMIVNKHLVRDLIKYNLWNNQIIGELLYDNGSVQKLDIPQELKDKYKTAYELKQSVIVKQAVDRGLFIDQSQSMNLFMENPDHNKLASAHIYAWKNGLKTGSYYIRTKPITEATKFSIDIEQINLIKLKRNINDLNLQNQINSNDKKTYNNNYETCETCSA